MIRQVAQDDQSDLNKSFTTIENELSDNETFTFNEPKGSLMTDWKCEVKNSTEIETHFDEELDPMEQYAYYFPDLTAKKSELILRKIKIVTYFSEIILFRLFSKYLPS